jgi:hypothetical protein
MGEMLTGLDFMPRVRLRFRDAERHERKYDMSYGAGHGQNSLVL